MKKLLTFFHGSARRRGVSVIIALLIVAGFMIQMAAITDLMRSSLTLHKNAINGEQAYWNARSGLEMGLFQSTHPDEPSPSLAGQGADFVMKNFSANVAVNPYTFTDGKQYSVFPFPGTGDVMGGCDVDKVPGKNATKKDENFIRDIFLAMIGREPTDVEIVQLKNPGTANATSPEVQKVSPLLSNLDVLDDPCLWNTLSSGQTVSIPFFVKKDTCSSTTTPGICNPQDIGLDEVILRVRTPCKSGVICKNDDRFVLFANVETPDLFSVAKKRAVFWDIVGDCDANNDGQIDNCYLSDNQTHMKTSFGSQVSGSVVNQQIGGAGSYSPQVAPHLQFSTNNPFLNGSSSNQKILTVLKTFSQPSLRLSIGSILHAYGVDGQMDSAELSSLQYQVLYRVNEGLAKDKYKISAFVSDPVVLATGAIGGFTTRLQTQLSKPAGSFQYVFAGN